MRPIIKVEAISKRFRIQPREAPSVRYPTLRESMVKVMRSPFAHLRNKGVRDDTVWALKDTSFEVMPGEVLGVIGPNGAGKSTLLKVLSRIIEPTSGRVELYGRVASLLEVGTGFHPDLSGRENVYLNGAILGMRRREIDTKFDEIVAFAEVEKFIDTAVKHYSSGMYLRLAFAVAAHLDPEILIVDEVLAVGDASFQKKCLGKMDDVTRSGRTVLLVTHGLGMVTQHCKRALLLNGGRIIKSGSAKDVVDHYSAMCGSEPV
jgi:homopolymeric O-antigen transport system ATP-binding protein